MNFSRYKNSFGIGFLFYQVLARTHLIILSGFYNFSKMVGTPSLTFNNCRTGWMKNNKNSFILFSPEGKECVSLVLQSFVLFLSLLSICLYETCLSILICRNLQQPNSSSFIGRQHEMQKQTKCKKSCQNLTFQFLHSFSFFILSIQLTIKAIQLIMESV